MLQFCHGVSLWAWLLTTGSGSSESDPLCQYCMEWVQAHSAVLDPCAWSLIFELSMNELKKTRGWCHVYTRIMRSWWLWGESSPNFSPLSTWSCSSAAFVHRDVLRFSVSAVFLLWSILWGAAGIVIFWAEWTTLESSKASWGEGLVSGFEPLIFYRQPPYTVQRNNLWLAACVFRFGTWQ